MPSSAFTPANAALLTACLVSIWAVKLYLQHRRVVLGVGNTPGPRTFFSAAARITLLLPNIPGINRRSNWTWKLKYRGKRHVRLWI